MFIGLGQYGRSRMPGCGIWSKGPADARGPNGSVFDHQCPLYGFIRRHCRMDGLRGRQEEDIEAMLPAFDSAFSGANAHHYDAVQRIDYSGSFGFPYEKCQSGSGRIGVGFVGCRYGNRGILFRFSIALLSLFER